MYLFACKNVCLPMGMLVIRCIQFICIFNQFSLPPSPSLPMFSLHLYICIHLSTPTLSCLTSSSSAYVSTYSSCSFLLRLPSLYFGCTSLCISLCLGTMSNHVCGRILMFNPWIAPLSADPNRYSYSQSTNILYNGSGCMHRAVYMHISAICATISHLVTWTLRMSQTGSFILFYSFIFDLKRLCR